MVEVKNDELFVEFFGEMNRVVEISDGWIWVEGESTGLPGMIKFSIFEEEFKDIGLVVE